MIILINHLINIIIIFTFTPLTFGYYSLYSDTYNLVGIFLTNLCRKECQFRFISRFYANTLLISIRQLE